MSEGWNNSSELNFTTPLDEARTGTHTLKVVCLEDCATRGLSHLLLRPILVALVDQIRVIAVFHAE